MCVCAAGNCKHFTRSHRSRFFPCFLDKQNLQMFFLIISSSILIIVICPALLLLPRSLRLSLLQFFQIYQASFAPALVLSPRSLRLSLRCRRMHMKHVDFLDMYSNNKSRNKYLLPLPPWYPPSTLCAFPHCAGIFPSPSAARERERGTFTLPCHNQNPPRFLNMFYCAFSAKNVYTRYS